MTQFVIDLLDGSNNVLGGGPLNNVLSVSVGEKLDEAGVISFVVPANDSRVANLLDTASRFRVHFSSGKLVYAIIVRDSIDVTADQPTRTITGADMLQELGNYSMGWWCLYDNKDLNTVILPDLVADTPWSLGTIDASLGTLYYTFDGDSRLAALIKIAQSTGKHFRLGSTFRTVDFGAFGAATTTRLTNVDHAWKAQDNTSDISIIGSLRVTTDRGPVINRIIPWGAGQDGGDTYRAKVSLFHLNPAAGQWSNIKAKPGVRGVQTTFTGVSDITGHHWIVGSTTGMFTTPVCQAFWCHDPNDLTAENDYDFVLNAITGSTTLTVRGSPTYPTEPTSFPAYVITCPQLYIQDDTAYAADPHEAVMIFDDISLPNLSLGAFESAALQLYNRAYFYLQTHKVPQVTYAVTVIDCPDTLRVGDTVPLVYRGIVTRDGAPLKWVDINTTQNVIGITRNYNADGSTSATIDVSNIARQPSDLVSMLSAGVSSKNSMGITVGAPAVATATVTGVPVTTAGIHAALVTLGLITA
jgi:hypothetical protein